MKRVIYSILYCVAFLAVTSCSEDITPETNTVNPGDITLSIFSAAPGTRAVVGPIPGVEALNENKINIVHYFFYPKNDTLSQPALIGRKGGYTEEDPALSAETEYSWTINVTDDKLKKTLFPMPYNSCNVYMIVNLPESISDAMEDNPDYDMSLPNLRRIALEANFDSTDPQASFVMEGLGAATIFDRKAILAAEGEIEVERVAAKISVNISVEDQLSPADGETTTNGLTWVSHPEDMEIELVNGVKTAVLGAIPTPVDKDNKFSTTPRRVTASNGAWSCAPFYSYPASWEIGAETEPYLRIRLPWTRVYTDANGETTSDGTPEYCIYKVILGGETLNRNTWYDLDIHIGILGGFENEPEVEIPLEDTHYFVADWSTGLSADASIEGARYLIVDKANYEVYNQDEVRIPFTSSHVCEIVDMSTSRVKNQATVTYPDYSGNSPNENSSITWNSNNWYIGIDNGEIVFRHAMRNDISAGKGNYDYAPYTIKFTIRHEDEKGNLYYKDITIKQYPAMIIECKPNRGLDGGYDTSGKDDGGVSVNGGDNYGGVHGLIGDNKNPNMYVISTSVLPVDSDYILGDPRSLDVNNLNNNSWANAKGIENLSGSDRKLQNYYPTLTTDAARDIIAPKFRIASSYGVTDRISYTNAQYRCASYQEDGYPAGRWRLPTQSEIAFIVQLSAQQVIPTLFTANNAYWCAGGSVTPNNNGTVTISQTTGNNTGPVRCVYDEWYWEASAYPRMPDNNVTFTWGDAAR